MIEWMDPDAVQESFYSNNMFCSYHYEQRPSPINALCVLHCFDEWIYRLHEDWLGLCSRVMAQVLRTYPKSIALRASPAKNKRFPTRDRSAFLFVKSNPIGRLDLAPIQNNESASSRQSFVWCHWSIVAEPFPLNPSWHRIARSNCHRIHLNDPRCRPKERIQIERRLIRDNEVSSLQMISMHSRNLKAIWPKSEYNG